MVLSRRVHLSLRPFLRASPSLLLLIPIIALLFLLLLPSPAFFSRPPCPQSTSSDLISQTSARPLASLHPTHLIIVAGHAIFTGPSWTPSALATESNWALEPYQTGFVATFLAHIRRGITLASASPLSVLIFAGGATRASAAPRTEAGTYFEVAAALGLAPLRNRTHIEPFSRDSFENILFSICRFKQLSGDYPQKISVVSFEFKRARFENLHRRALRFPREDFAFTGIDPPPAPGGMRGSYAARERASTVGPFSRDPYGCRERVLRDKRVLRNAASLMFHPYPGGCEEIAPLFTYCGRTVFSGSLPWDKRDGVVDEIDASKVR